MALLVKPPATGWTPPTSGLRPGGWVLLLGALGYLVVYALVVGSWVPVVLLGVVLAAVTVHGR